MDAGGFLLCLSCCFSSSARAISPFQRHCARMKENGLRAARRKRLRLVSRKPRATRGFLGWAWCSYSSRSMLAKTRGWYWSRANAYAAVRASALLSRIPPPRYLPRGTPFLCAGRNIIAVACFCHGADHAGRVDALFSFPTRNTLRFHAATNICSALLSVLPLYAAAVPTNACGDFRRQTRPSFLSAGMWRVVALLEFGKRGKEERWGR